MTLPDVSIVENGKAILFLGAGFSADAKNIAGEFIKDVSGLIDQLLSLVNIPSSDGYDLDTASQEFIDSYEGNAKKKISELIHSNFSSKTYTEAQRVVVCQPWYRIYTTNYDNVVENIFAEESKYYTEKILTDKVEPPINGTQLLHIYGSIRRLSPDEFAKSFLLTETQRDGSPFLKSTWYRRFNDDVLAAKAIFFVGFSMSDIDLRRILSALPQEVKNKIHFITWVGEKKPVLTRLSKFGSVYTCAVEGFADYLKCKRTGPAKVTEAEVPVAMQRLEYTPQSEADISAFDVRELLLSGDIDMNLLAQVDTEGTPGSYTIPRNPAVFARALSAAKAGKPILIHADIGNGKTIFSQVFGYHFSINGYEVYSVRREPDNIGNVIEYIQSQSGKAVIILDDIMKFLKLPQAILNIGNSDIVLLGTVRSNTLDISRHLVESRLQNKKFFEVDLNFVRRDETLRWVQYFDENGLFGNRSDLDQKSKLSIIERRCGGQLRDVMLELYSRGALHQRVSEFLDSIAVMSTDSQNIIALSALLTLTNFQELASYANLSELIDSSLSLQDFQDECLQKGLLGLLSVRNGEVILRSPALALFILKKTFGLSRTLAVSKSALFYINQYLADEHDFLALGKVLLKYSTYGEMVKTDKDSEVMNSFYNNCRVLKFAQNDPLFWVQRSICCMKIPNFELANDFVDTAFATAKKLPNFDTYQIENHSARLSLTKSLDKGPSPAGESEVAAAMMLQSVMARKSGDMYHPLSVMRIIPQIVDKHILNMNALQCSALAGAIDASLKSLASSAATSGRFRGIPELERSLKGARRRLANKEFHD